MNLVLFWIWLCCGEEKRLDWTLISQNSFFFLKNKEIQRRMKSLGHVFS